MHTVRVRIPLGVQEKVIIMDPKDNFRYALSVVSAFRQVISEGRATDDEALETVMPRDEQETNSLIFGLVDVVDMLVGQITLGVADREGTVVEDANLEKAKTAIWQQLALSINNQLDN